MAKQNINVGTAANDKKGDSLRAAFVKVNANFTELYTVLGINADVSLNLGAFEFAGSVMSTTDSTPIVIDQSVTVSSDLTVGGDIVPQTALGGDLGSSTLPWRSLYVSQSTIYLGGVPLSLDASNNLTVNGSPVTGGGVSSLVNSTKTVSLGSDGTLTVPAGGRISAASGYNLTLGDGLLLGQGGSIFNENEDGLYLGGQNSDAGTYIQIPGRTASENGESMQIVHQWENASIDFSNYGGLWSFGSDGAFTIPNYGQLRPSSAAYDAALAGWESFRSQEAESAALLGYTEAMRPFIGWRVNGGNVAAYLAELDRVWAIQNTGGATLVWTPPISSALRAQMRAAMLAVQNAYSSVGPDVSIASGQGKYWNFSGDGTLTIPGDIRSEGNINIEINLADSTLRRWQFGEDGLLTFPDATVQSTAWTGTVGTQATLNVTGAITAETFNTDQITIVGNRISTTVTNANLELECNGTGGVVINRIADATTASTAKSVGYLGVPASTVTTSSTLTIADAGEHVYVNSASQTITIPANSSVAYPVGTTITFIAGPSATTVSIAITTDTMYLAGTGTTGSRTLAAYGMATAIKVAATVWFINGTGLT